MVEKNRINVKLIVSLLAIFVGIVFYIAWGVTYGIWADAGIYSITAFFLIAGILGILLERIK